MHGGSPLSEAGMPIPFPLQPAWFTLSRLPRGRCLQHAAPLMCLGRLAEVSRSPRHLAISAASYFRDRAVMQASLLGDLAQREASGLSVGECLAPRLSHILGVLLELGLSIADGLAGAQLWVGGHS